MAAKILIFRKSNSIKSTGVFGALSPNPGLKLQNSKWRIQCGGKNFNCLQIKLYFVYMGFFGALSPNPRSKLPQFFVNPKI